MMRPEFGTPLPDLVAGRSVNSQASGPWIREVRSSLSRFVEGIEVLDVSVTDVDGQPGAIDVTVKFRSHHTGEVGSVNYRPVMSGPGATSTESYEEPPPAGRATGGSP
jgi:phage baseplate assembly protein W